MAYLVVILLALGSLTLTAPIRSDLHAAFPDDSRRVSDVVAEWKDRAGDSFSALQARVRTKALALLREQLHDIVDEAVR